jgi:small subunit ribosomal protein S6
MRPYETVIIFDVELEESALTALLNQGLDIVRTGGGNVGTVDRWGRRTLAYELRHKREGYYVLAEFTADPKASAELDRFLSLADGVLRHKIMRVPAKQVGRIRQRPAPVNYGGHGGHGASRPAPAAAVAAPAEPAVASLVSDAVASDTE